MTAAERLDVALTEMREAIDERRRNVAELRRLRLKVRDEAE